jgi:hypothetical protein
MGQGMTTVLILAHWLYSQECCHEQHCHRVPCDEIVDLGQGWKWHDKVFPKFMLRASPDGECHVCMAAAPLCIYLPPRV